MRRQDYNLKQLRRALNMMFVRNHLLELCEYILNIDGISAALIDQEKERVNKAFYGLRFPDSVTHIIRATAHFLTTVCANETLGQRLAEVDRQTISALVVEILNYKHEPSQENNLTYLRMFAPQLANAFEAVIISLTEKPV